MAKKTTKAKTTKRNINDSTQETESIFSFVKRGVKSEKFPRAVAVFTFLFVVFCFISFTSYFVTWFSDYSLVESITPYSLLVAQSNINNWCGNIGAFVAYVFIRYTFGFASFGFLIVFALIGLRLFGVIVKKSAKWIVSTLTIMLWLSCVFGFVVEAAQVHRLEDFAGIVGTGLNMFLCNYIGAIGCFLVLLAFTIVVPILLFNVKYSVLCKQIGQKLSTRAEATDHAEETGSKQRRIIPAQKVNLERGHREKIEQKDEQDKSLVVQESKREREQESEAEDGQNLENEKEQSLEDFGDLRREDNPDRLSEDEKKEVTRFTVKRNGETITIDDIEEKTRGEKADEADDKDVSFTIKNDACSGEDKQEKQIQENINTMGEPYNPHLDLSRFTIPSTDILTDYDKKNKVVSEAELIANNKKIQETLKNYGIAITSIEATPGPTVTLYEIVPAPGVRISKIKNLADDIALSLSALGIRIIAPIPGKGTIGIEVPNSNPQIVSMKTMIESPEFVSSKAELPVVIGKTIENEPFVTDLAKAPHLLMAGATGQGKSVGLNAIVASLLYKKHPSELKFVFVDPKKVELSLYSGLVRHYLAKIPSISEDEAVITDVNEVEKTLRSLCALMDERYNLLKDAQCKKITEYNQKFISRRIPPLNGHGYMPYIVVVVDEFADLIMTAGRKIEEPICRLAQLARAVGIHLIIATQRPSVDIITGKIKANFPARAAFKTSSMVDSKTILDTPGAEQLIGRGDMLFSAGGKVTRLQCALIDTPEIENLVQCICEQDGYPTCFTLPDPPSEESQDKDPIELSSGKLDPLFEDAAICMVDTQHGSTSTLQRKFAIGYNRAGKIVDQLEANGIVGPFRGSKPREVLVKSREELDGIFAQLSNR